MSFTNAVGSGALQVLAASASLSVSPAQVIPGATVTFSGTSTLPNTSLSIANYNTNVPTGVPPVITPILTVTTNSSGAFSATWTVPYSVAGLPPGGSAGAWMFIIYFGGSIISGSALLYVYYKTRIASFTLPPTALVNQTVAVSGGLQYNNGGTWTNMPSQTIALTYDGTSIGSVITDSNGNFSKSFSIGASGTYTVKATFTGSVSLAEAEASGGVLVGAIGVANAVPLVLSVLGILAAVASVKKKR